MLNKPHAENLEVEALKEICMCIGSLKGNDPHNIVKGYLKSVKLSQEVVHEVNFAEDLFKGVLFFKEVLEMIQSESSKENIQKEEDIERDAVKEQFNMLLQRKKE
jgi:hypothetical protein